MARDNWESDALQRQNEYQNQFYEWKEYDRQCFPLLKTNIGLLLFGEAEVSDSYLPLILYHKNYGTEQRKSIKFIFNKIINLLSNSSCVQFGHTLLSIKVDSGIEYVIFRCRSSKYLNEIYFIEPNGRVYKSWNDFVKNNKLPSCEYIAPQNGIYIQGKYFVKLRSPAKKNGSSKKLVDFLTAVVSVGSIVAGIFAVAPVTTGAVGVTIGIFGTTQSVLSLHDRYTHGESIRFDNRESNLNYANIIMSVLGGISSVATSNVNKIQRLSGKYGILATRTVKLVNYATLVFDAGLFTVDLLDTLNKIETKEFSLSDATKLAVRTFFLYGSVVNVLEMHQVLTENSLSPVAASTPNVESKKLTKSQKNNIRKRRAKALKKQQEKVVGTTRVTESDVFSSIRHFPLRAGSVALKILLQKFPRCEVIYEEFKDVASLCWCYFTGKIPFENLISSLLPHLKNLYFIIRTDLDEVKKFFQKNFNDIPCRDDVVQTGINGFDQVKQAEQDILDLVTDEMDCTDVGTTSNDSTDNQFQQEINEEESSVYKIILDTAKYLISHCIVPEATCPVIIMFHSALSFVCKELLQCKSGYDNLFAANKYLVGEEKANKMFLALGRKIGDDIILNDKIIAKHVRKIRNKVDEFIASYCTTVKKAETSMSPFISEIVNDSLNKIANVFLTNINYVGKLGLGKTIDVLLYISTSFVKNVVSEVESRKVVVDILCIENEILGEEIVTEMLENIGMHRNELDIFKSVLKTLFDNENNDFMIDIINYCSEICATSQINFMVICEGNFEDDLSGDNMYLFFSVCCKMFCNLVSTNNICEEDKANLYKRSIHFITYKIISELNILKGKYEHLKLLNTHVVGPQVSKIMLRNLGVFDQETFCLLKHIYKKLIEEDRLIEEFFEYYNCNTPDLERNKLWENTIGDEGFIMYKIDCYLGRPDEYYRTFAEDLFKIEVERDAVVKRHLNFIILKFRNIVIAFNFSLEVNDEAIVVLVDVCADSN